MENVQVDAIVKNIQDGINTLKTKGENNEAELKNLQSQIKSLSSKSETAVTVKAAQDFLQRQFDDLAAKLQKNPAYSLGATDHKGLRALIRENKDAFTNLKEKGDRAVSFSIKAPNLFMKLGNVTEGGNLTGDVIAPLRLQDIYRDPLRPVHIREFMNLGDMSSNQVLFNQLTGELDGSAATAEGSSATQSSFALTAQEIVARKLNTFLNISKEMLEDASFVESYIKTQVVGRILMLEDVQVLNGNGSSPNLQGITPVCAAYNLVAIPNTSPSTANYYDVLMQAVTQAKIGYYTPNYIIVHPNDYQAIVTARDSYGRYQFQQNLGSNNSAFYIGGAMVIANTAMSQGNFLVGDFEKGATLFQRDDLNISFSNQNQDNFITGFVTVLVEERLANVIYRPNAFVYGTFSTAIAAA